MVEARNAFTPVLRFRLHRRQLRLLAAVVLALCTGGNAPVKPGSPAPQAVAAKEAAKMPEEMDRGTLPEAAATDVAVVRRPIEADLPPGVDEQRRFMIFLLMNSGRPAGPYGAFGH